ncbi:pentatricopeptide repeat-containing protein [Senna tora]|uniref:Pentatricopeptide repeat-containing protein n=1 Tax=Senna tora TaxID=362788 RepID=A0A834TX16_9FABA|nr:pentatricopeptide repeat-containing protein [Senna tora]
MRHLYQIQAQLVTFPVPPDSKSVNPNKIAVKLIGVCGARANTHHAALFFGHFLTNPNIVAYNALLKAYAQNNEWQCTIYHFNKQLVTRDAPSPDEYTFTSVLKACAGLSLAVEGEKLHCFVTKYGCEANLFVCNSLMDLYFKVGQFGVAHKLFDKMLVRDVVSWNTLLSGYCLGGNLDKARWIFDGMVEKSTVSWSTMINGYAKVGELYEARQLFDKMPERNVVSWNAMIAGYAQNERYADAIELFRQMQQQSSMVPNDATLVSVLSACAQLGALDLGKWIHDRFIRRSKMKLRLFLGNSLADMYAKCGCIVDARQVFNSMQEKDVISWTILITGLAMHGHANEAFGCFREMLEHGIRPNDITFMGLLTACTHAGLVDKGLEYFHMMDQVYGISPKIEHYGVYKDTERGIRVAQHILELDPDHSGSYVYLTNIYASKGRLDDAAKCRLRMRDNGVMKIPGCSWIEVDNTVHEFFMGDLSHPQSEKIYLMIRELRWKMKLAGYKPKTDLVVHNVEEEEKEDALSSHSEKLALAFGLISTSEGTTIRIVKNLRVCDDCHDAIKIISLLVRREIIVRDRSRFHHFRDGTCSCNDFW